MVYGFPDKGHSYFNHGGHGVLWKTLPFYLCLTAALLFDPDRSRRQIRGRSLENLPLTCALGGWGRALGISHLLQERGAAPLLSWVVTWDSVGEVDSLLTRLHLTLRSCFSVFLFAQ